MRVYDSALVQLCISIGSAVVEIGGDLWCRVGAGVAQIWFSFGTAVVCSCRWPQFMWFSFGSALVQVRVAVWFTGSGEVLMWFRFASVGRAIHGVWFSMVGLFGSAMIYRSIICGACVDHIVVG